MRPDNDICKGIEQQNLAKQILKDPAIRQSYLAGWFPGTTLEDTANMNIQTCIICSHRLFGGMNFKEVAIRDFQSFTGNLTEQVVSHSIIERNKEATLIKHSLVGPHGFSLEDIDNHLRSDAKFFQIFHENMVAVSHFEELIPGKLALLIVYRMWLKTLRNFTRNGRFLTLRMVVKDQGQETSKKALTIKILSDGGI